MTREGALTIIVAVAVGLIGLLVWAWWRRMRRDAVALVHPGELGMELYDRRAIEVHTVAESKAMIQAVLEGQLGPAHNIVALNAGAAIYVSGLAKTLKAGVEQAARAIKSGAAKQKAEEFIAFTQKTKAKA